jgi:peptide methionine sulfoxide reductase MsrA
VKIEFDPSILTYEQLVGGWWISFFKFSSLINFWNFEEFFYRTHDPTTVNRQGADTGSRKILIQVVLEPTLT